MKVAALTLLIALSSAPAVAAPPLPADSTYIRADDYRVAAIAYRIGLAGAAYCPDRAPLTGLLLHYLAEYEAPGRATMVDAYGMDRGPGILAVIGGSPAARAGLAAGDVILTFDGKPLPAPDRLGAAAGSGAAREAIEAVEGQIEDRLRQGPVPLRILRDGAEHDLILDSVAACPARARLARSGQTNAFANGRYVILTTAILAFARTDDELATILSHELAHNILGHPARLRAAGVPRGLLRGFGKNASRVRETEVEADRLGLRLAWAAGYDVSAAIPFWRRYYEKYDAPLQLFRTHPSLDAREALAAQVIAELQAESDQGAQRP